MVTLAPIEAIHNKTRATPARDAQSAHLVGVCGAGMKALAELLIGMGWSVSGSDAQPSPSMTQRWARHGLRIHPGHNGQFLPPNAGVLVYSPAVAPENPERQRAAALGIEQLSYSQMLGRLMQDRIGVCIAGTHGKSTTTAMTGCVLERAGASPSVVVGAELRERQVNGWAGDGLHFVVESCEYQRNFLDLSPTLAVITGIEPDHFDCYQSFDETVAAFAAFAQKLPSDGRLIIPAGCEATKAACLAAEAPAETFSLLPDADWWASDIRETREGIRFRMFREGEFFTEIALRVPGEHNVLNALAAAAVCHRAGASAQAIRDGLNEFAGLRRRFDVVGTWRGVTLIDDYAHHPTAVAATLKTARAWYPGRRIWCVFQPHQVSRTRVLLADFAESLALADETVVVPVFVAREQVTDEPVTMSKQLAEKTVQAGGRAQFSASLDRTLATLDDALQPGDVLITMGAGDIGQVHHAFTRRLQRHHSA